MRKGGYSKLTESQSYHRATEEQSLFTPSRTSLRTYVFGNGDVLNSDEGSSGSETTEFEMCQVRTRGGATVKKQRPLQDVYMLKEKEIQKTDSLHSIALQYRCQVAELKRVNNLIQDQDFYALRTIKVPYKPNSALHEILNAAEGDESKQSSQNGSLVHAELDVRTDADMYNGGVSNLVRTVSIGDLCKSEAPSPNSFLTQMDKDLEKLRQSTCSSLQTSLDHAAAELTAKRFHPLKRDTNGADCGIRWYTALLLVFIFSVAAPLVYFFYFEYQKH